MRWVEFGPQGWVHVSGLFESVEGESEPVFVLAKTCEWEGRRVIVDLVINTAPLPPGITAATLKAIPIGWIESVINTPRALARLAEQDEADFSADPTVVALWQRRECFTELAEGSYAVDEVPRLARPDGVDPEGFYRQVAVAYVAAVASSGKPAAVIAERSEVPVTTVHRWIAEARRRGFLPPARKGRAG